MGMRIPCLSSAQTNFSPTATFLEYVTLKKVISCLVSKSFLSLNSVFTMIVDLIAIEAETPEDYYLNPSDNLMKVTSMWSVVEHADVLEVSINTVFIGDLVFIMPNGEENIINILVDVENKKKDARFHHQDGMKKN
ncbi:hypothetical protein C5167_012476 [Papaver somniferum]|uniref:Uncharacterized protein n=1 Tax=Papaver somniferum TaxID=3469 RepID=A0A4Y7IZK0_PAPSO|nr:hypothetical protein C5167_012476 [Papaver somniferum]